jgi:predicted O-linked N-acetylglucosamine transferase (SPINDLY family)
LDVFNLSDEELANRIVTDRIDILIHTAGHTANNRLKAMSLKPAPIQISWPGYIETTGVSAIDYMIGDHYITPLGCEDLYSEKILRLPDNIVCVDTPTYDITVGTLPALQNGYMTFGCFNNPVKINSEVISVWSKALDALPTSKLVLKYRGITSTTNRERILSEFTNNRIDPERIELEDYSPSLEDLYRRYNDIDIAFDCFPFSGGATTYDALWMGVPVITLPGQRPSSRLSLSRIENVGLQEFIAHDASDFVAIALKFANDLNKLACIRDGLRERVEKSPLQDGPRFAEAFSNLMRETWKSFLKGKS